MDRKERRRRKARYRFTRQDCQKGYRAALAVCMQDWHRYAWFCRKVRGYYRGQRRKDAEDCPF
jgi:hypothetical protein